MAHPMLQAHRGGLVHAMGSGTTMVTAGRFGAITLWPEAELRSIAEGAGFVLPTRAAVEHTGEVARPATISQVCMYNLKNYAACCALAACGAVIFCMVLWCCFLFPWQRKDSPCLSWRKSRPFRGIEHRRSKSVVLHCMVKDSS